jgi:hypothetical protein
MGVFKDSSDQARAVKFLAKFTKLGYRREDHQSTMSPPKLDRMTILSHKLKLLNVLQILITLHESKR